VEDTDRARPARRRPAAPGTGRRAWRSGGCSAPAAATTPGEVPTCHAVHCSPCGTTRHFLDRSSSTSRVAHRWRGAEESWHVRLRSIGGHGSWKGVDPLDGLDAGTADGPVAIITRAERPAPSVAAFGAASEVVDAELHRAPGLIDVVGDRRGPGRESGDVQPVGVARRCPELRVLDARPPRGHAAHPCGGLVRGGVVRPVRALCVERHVERSRPARGGTASS
jgi:hypothetical protein